MPQRLLDPSQRGPDTMSLHKTLGEMVVGQADAIEKVVELYQLQLAGLQAPGRPLGSMLLLGPTGTGKTRLVEALSMLLHGDSRYVLKIDCAEYQHGHEIAKLIGSPPGYLGHRETHPILSQKILDAHRSDDSNVTLLLLDEIEKASDTLWNLFLGILDKATLTLGDNSRVDFSRVMIFMTSNVGSREIQNALSPMVGFAPTSGDGTSDRGKIEKVGDVASRKKFTPEFLNRIDRCVVFRPLEREDLRKILDLELRAIQTRIDDACCPGVCPTRFLISLTETVKEQILDEGTDARYGARHLKRILERSVMYPIVNLLTSGQISSGDTISIQREDSQLKFYKASA